MVVWHHYWNRETDIYFGDQGVPECKCDKMPAECQVMSYQYKKTGVKKSSSWFDPSCSVIVWITDTCQCITIRNAVLSLSMDHKNQLWATLTCHIKLIKWSYNIDQWLMTVVATSKETLLQICLFKVLTVDWTPVKYPRAGALPLSVWCMQFHSHNTATHPEGSRNTPFIPSHHNFTTLFTHLHS